jgi:hypothetical protein
VNGGLVLLIVAVVCFLGVAVFASSMHDPEQVHRVIAAGLAALAGAHAWTNWGPGRTS